MADSYVMSNDIVYEMILALVWHWIHDQLSATEWAFVMKCHSTKQVVFLVWDVTSDMELYENYFDPQIYFPITQHSETWQEIGYSWVLSAQFWQRNWLALAKTVRRGKRYETLEIFFHFIRSSKELNQSLCLFIFFFIFFIFFFSQGSFSLIYRKA